MNEMKFDIPHFNIFSVKFHVSVFNSDLFLYYPIFFLVLRKARRTAAAPWLINESSPGYRR